MTRRQKPQNDQTQPNMDFHKDSYKDSGKILENRGHQAEENPINRSFIIIFYITFSYLMTYLFKFNTLLGAIITTTTTLCAISLLQELGGSFDLNRKKNKVIWVIWRLIYGLGLSYFLFLAILLFLPNDAVIKILAELFPTSLLPRDHGGCNKMDCNINWHTFFIQMTKVWVLAHMYGGAFKVLLLRNWQFSLFIDLMFEFTEMTFQWIIDDFCECWWDSLVLDNLNNIVGIFVGYLVLKYFTNEERGQMEKYDWTFFSSYQGVITGGMICLYILFGEVNTFLLNIAVNVKVTHPLFMLRHAILVVLAAPAISELYHNLNEGSLKLNANGWLPYAIVNFELLFSLRHGWYWFEIQKKPQLTTLVVWIASAMLFAYYLRRTIPKKRQSQTTVSKPPFPFYMCFLPLTWLFTLSKGGFFSF